MRRIILRADKIYNIIGYQENNASKSYLPSQFCIEELIDDGILLYNTLTCELIYLSQNEYDDRLTNDYLIRHWFVIDEDVDQYTMCKTFKKIYNQIKRKKNIDKLSHYTIMTTTNCNARCGYCYESDCIKHDMTDQIASDIVDFIKRMSSSNITIRWFGGEPLYNSNIIDIISSQLKKENIVYSSSMISNGYLFHEHNVDKLKNIWHLKKVQITLDGMSGEYNKTKNYIYPDKNPFQKVINNIEYLLNNDIIVNIRMNISNSNIQSLYSLSDYIHLRFSSYKNFHAYSRPLFDDSNNIIIDDSTMMNEYIKLQKHLKSLGIQSDYSINNIKFGNCMADSMNSIVITPTGKLTLCEHYSDSEIIGDIYQNELDIKAISEWKKAYEISDCKTCQLLPRCTKIKKCPVSGCTDILREHSIYQIKNSMKNTYNKIKESRLKNGI